MLALLAHLTGLAMLSFYTWRLVAHVRNAAHVRISARSAPATMAHYEAKRLQLPNQRALRSSNLAGAIVYIVVLTYGQLVLSNQLQPLQVLGLLAAYSIVAAVCWIMGMALVPFFEALLLDYHAIMSAVVHVMYALYCNYGQALGMLHGVAHFERTVSYNLFWVLEDVEPSLYVPVMGSVVFLHMVTHVQNVPLLWSQPMQLISVAGSYSFLGLALPLLCSYLMQGGIKPIQMPRWLFSTVCAAGNVLAVTDLMLRTPSLVSHIHAASHTSTLFHVLRTYMMGRNGDMYPGSGSSSRSSIHAGSCSSGLASIGGETCELVAYGLPTGFAMALTASLLTFVMLGSSLSLLPDDSPTTSKTAAKSAPWLKQNSLFFTLATFMNSLPSGKRYTVCCMVAMSLLQCMGIMHIAMRLLMGRHEELVTTAPPALAVIMLGAIVEVVGVLYVVMPPQPPQPLAAAPEGSGRSSAAGADAQLRLSGSSPLKLARSPSASARQSTETASTVEAGQQRDSDCASEQPPLRDANGSGAGSFDKVQQQHQQHQHQQHQQQHQQRRQHAAKGGEAAGEGSDTDDGFDGEGPLNLDDLLAQRAEALATFKAFMQSLDQQPGACSLEEFTRGAAFAMKSVFPGVHHASFCLLNSSATGANMYVCVGEEAAQKSGCMGAAVAPGTLMFHVMATCQPVFIPQLEAFQGDYSDLQFMQFALGLRSLACLPLVLADCRILGVLQLGFESPYDWDDTEQDMAKQLAFILGSGGGGGAGGGSADEANATAAVAGAGGGSAPNQAAAAAPLPGRADSSSTILVSGSQAAAGGSSSSGSTPMPLMGEAAMPQRWLQHRASFDVGPWRQRPSIDLQRQQHLQSTRFSIDLQMPPQEQATLQQQQQLLHHPRSSLEVPDYSQGPQSPYQQPGPYQQPLPQQGYQPYSSQQQQQQFASPRGLPLQQQQHMAWEDPLGGGGIGAAAMWPWFGPNSSEHTSPHGPLSSGLVAQVGLFNSGAMPIMNAAYNSAPLHHITPLDRSAAVMGPPAPASIALPGPLPVAMVGNPGPIGLMQLQQQQQAAAAAAAAAQGQQQQQGPEYGWVPSVIIGSITDSTGAEASGSSNLLGQRHPSVGSAQQHQQQQLQQQQQMAGGGGASGMNGMPGINPYAPSIRPSSGSGMLFSATGTGFDQQQQQQQQMAMAYNSQVYGQPSGRLQRQGTAPSNVAGFFSSSIGWDIEDTFSAASSGNFAVTPAQQLAAASQQQLPVSVLSDVQMMEIIGRGGFGSVYKAVWRGDVVAVKVVEHGDDFLGCADNSARRNDSGGRRAALLEGAMTSTICHSNVVQTYDYRVVHLSPQPVGHGLSASRVMQETHIIMEYCDRGSLQDAMERKMFYKKGSQQADAPQLDMEAVIMTLAEVSHAMDYLHSHRITHRDLKPKNILLKSSNKDRRGFTSKVSDFGLSQVLPDTNRTQVSQKYSGTVTHMAPELIEEGRVYQQGDVFAFGIIMWEVYTGSAPYQNMAHPQIMVAVVTHNLRPKFPDSCPEWYKTLASKCWRKDPKLRPSFSEISSALLQMLTDKNWQPFEDCQPREQEQQQLAQQQLQAQQQQNSQQLQQQEEFHSQHLHNLVEQHSMQLQQQQMQQQQMQQQMLMQQQQQSQQLQQQEGLHSQHLQNLVDQHSLHLQQQQQQMLMQQQHPQRFGSGQQQLVGMSMSPPNPRMMSPPSPPSASPPTRMHTPPQGLQQPMQQQRGFF